jgi:predicted nucleic acid-binding protein
VNAYVDASVVLRRIFGQPGALAEWPRIDVALSSELVRVECLRTIDRARLISNLPDDEVSRLRAEALDTIEVTNLLSLGAGVLARAAEPFPTQLGTLDAIHLASAIVARDHFEDLVFATHDRTLGLAARAMGFQVTGI